MPETPYDEGPLPGRWVHLVNLMLGAWLVTSPFSLGYSSLELTRSDEIAGVVLMFVAVLGLLNPAFRYVTAFVGLWLVLAPLLFWSPDPVAYANDTLVGAMVLTLTLLLPARAARAGPDRPTGWSYNPSSFAQRAPVVVLGLVGFLTARYLAAFQLGYVDAVYDPFFGGSEEVLRSGVARAWPVPDAGLGALACLAAIGMAFVGDRYRFRTMPWIVMLFALLIVPLGVFGVVLVALQPLAVGAWCTWCLVTSAAMLFMVPFTIDEVVATVQFLQQRRREGHSLWWTSWLGGPDLEVGEPETVERQREPGYALRGMGVPIPLVASLLLGAWLVGMPFVVGAPGGVDHVVGALVIAVSAISFAEVARPLRYVNLLAAVWLLIGPFVLPAEHDQLTAWNDRIVGLLLIVLTLPIGRLRERYGKLDLALSWPMRPRTT